MTITERLGRKEYLVCCVDSTRRTRRDAPAARETRCVVCHASILVSPETVAAGQSTDLYLLCPRCTIEVVGPEDRVTALVPGTQQALDAYGIDGARLLAEHVRKPVATLAATALQNSGQVGS